MTEEMQKVYIPALVALLTRAEELAGRPLKENEVLRIRDDANCIDYPAAAMPAFVEQRGYHDIHAPDAWEQWQQFKSGKLDLNLKSDGNS